MGVPTVNSSWFFGSGTNASTAVLTPAQVSAVAPLVRVTAAYVVMYYAFCFFQSWSKLYLSVWRCPVLFFAPAFRPLARRSSRLFDEAPPPPTSGVRAPRLAWRGGLRLRTSTRAFGERRGDGVPSSASRDRDCCATTSPRAGRKSLREPPIRHRRKRPHTPSTRRDAADAIRIDTIHDCNAGGGRCRRTPTARSRRSCS